MFENIHSIGYNRFIMKYFVLEYWKKKTLDEYAFLAEKKA